MNYGKNSAIRILNTVQNVFKYIFQYNKYGIGIYMVSWCSQNVAFKVQIMWL